MGENIIDSFYNNEPKQEEVKQPNENLNSSQDDNLEKITNSENQGENQNQGEKDQKKTETPAVEKKHWSETAYLDEKGKRQELEKKLKELEAQFLQPKEEVKKPDAIDDPEAAIKYSQDQLQQQIWTQKVGLSESIIKSMGDKFSDYEEKKTLFMDLAKDDPSLAQKLRNSDNPALFAYETAKNHLKVKII